MSKKTIYFLGIILTIILGTYLYWLFCCSVCCGKASCNYNKEPSKSIAEPTVKKTTKNAFVITDATSDFNVKANTNFNFKTSSFSIINPVTADVTEGVSKLKDYLLANPLKTVDITGFYKTNEVNNSAYPNLGLARANAVKNYLVSSGVSTKQVNTTGTLNDSITPNEEDTLFGPINYGITTKNPSDSTATDALKTACNAIKDNPIKLYFQTGQADINLTPEQRQKIVDISHCVDQLEMKILVIGHTDNTGDANINISLGQKRADFVKAYLVSNGILASDIETASKGQKEPIADNNTETGRAKNRRTVITIK